MIAMARNQCRGICGILEPGYVSRSGYSKTNGNRMMELRRFYTSVKWYLGKLTRRCVRSSRNTP